MKTSLLAPAAAAVLLAQGNVVCAQDNRLPPALDGPGMARVWEAGAPVDPRASLRKHGPESLPTREVRRTANDAATDDHFAVSAAMSVGTAVVGAWLKDDQGIDSGAAYVFEQNQGGTNNWGPTAKLLPTSGGSNDRFGVSVAISTNVLVVGAYLNDTPSGADSGAAYIFERMPGQTNWSKAVRLPTPTNAAAGDQFGISVAVDGDLVVVGAYKEDANAQADSGAAYIFQRDPGDPNKWNPMPRLTPTNSSAGAEFGISVAVSGDTVAVGAWGEDIAGVQDAGAVYVFERVSKDAPWNQKTNLVSVDPHSGDWFGRAVALNQNTLLVGARGGGSNQNSGSVCVYRRTSTNWTFTTKLTANDGEADDQFGVSVALNGETAVIGAVGKDQGLGAAYLFNTSDGTNWNQFPKLTASDGDHGDMFGISVGLSADTVLAGAFLNDAAGTNAGEAYFFFANGAPVAAPDTFFVLEDTTFNDTVLTNDFDPDSDTVTAALIGSPNNITLGAQGVFKYTPDANYNGTNFFTYYVTDGRTNSSIVTVSLVVLPVNDPPSFTVGPNITVLAGSGGQTVSNWARNISAGPGETNQKAIFTVTTPNTNLFLSQPAITNSQTGDLSFTVGFTSGTAIATVVLRDDGGTNNGGIDESSPQTFTITVTNAPTITIAQAGTNTITVSWTLGGNLRLQQSSSLSPPNWTYAPSGSNNFVTIPLTASALFFRAFP